MFRSFTIAKSHGGHLGGYWIALAVILHACPLPASESTATGPFLPDLKNSVIRQYADVVYATYRDAWVGATNFQSCVQAFLQVPSKESMARARQAWVAARCPYLQSEVFRFYDGPIDEEGWINAWPIDEALIDYVISGSAPECRIGKILKGLGSLSGPIYRGISFEDEDDLRLQFAICLFPRSRPRPRFSPGLATMQF